VLGTAFVMAFGWAWMRPCQYAALSSSHCERKRSKVAGNGKQL
jgi:hypothetical protein